MPKPLKVLLLPPAVPGHVGEIEVVKAVGSRHDLRIYDREAPLAAQFEGIEVVIDYGGSVGTRAMADVAASVKLWQILGTGVDHFDLEYWAQKNIPVANTPGQFSGLPLAECAMMFMIMLSRHWKETQENLSKGILSRPLGSEMENRVLGLVGFGASGRELARRAKAFGMRIRAIDIREVPPEEQKEFGLEFVGKPRDLDKMIAGSDFVSLHLHLDNETRHLINERRLGLMKPTAFLINVARGALVDEKALYAALTAGRLAGAGLDVFAAEPPNPDDPLLRLPNVIATPHISGNTDATWRRRAGCAAENIDRLAAGLEPLYRIQTRPDASVLK